MTKRDWRWSGLAIFLATVAFASSTGPATGGLPPASHPITSFDDVRFPTAVFNQTFEVAIDNASYWFAYASEGTLVYNITLTGSSGWLNETVAGSGGFVLERVAGQRLPGTYRFSFMGSATILIADMGLGLRMQADGSAETEVVGPVASFVVFSPNPASPLRISVSMTRNDVSAYVVDRRMSLIAQREDSVATKELDIPPTGESAFYLVLLSPGGSIGSVSLEYTQTIGSASPPTTVVSPWPTVLLLVLVAVALAAGLEGARRGWPRALRAKFRDLRLPKRLRNLPPGLAVFFLVTSLVLPWWVIHANIVQRDPQSGAEVFTTAWTVSYGLWGNGTEQSGGSATLRGYDSALGDAVSVVFRYAALLALFGQGGGIALSLIARKGRYANLLMVTSGTLAASAALWVFAELPSGYNAVVETMGVEQARILSVDSFVGSRTSFIFTSGSWFESQLSWGPGLGWILSLLAWLAVLVEIGVQTRERAPPSFRKRASRRT